MNVSQHWAVGTKNFQVLRRYSRSHVRRSEIIHVLVNVSKYSVKIFKLQQQRVMLKSKLVSLVAKL